MKSSWSESLRSLQPGDRTPRPAFGVHRVARGIDALTCIWLWGLLACGPDVLRPVGFSLLFSLVPLTTLTAFAANAASQLQPFLLRQPFLQ